MQTIPTIHALRTKLKKSRSSGKTIGFVPSMGYLHEGHLSLVRASKKACDVTVVSIFVNPTQFGPNEDLAKYPRDLDRDLAMLKKEGVDFVLTPSVEEMYPTNEPRTFVEVPELGQLLCGKTRPTHFRGVTTVVNKLFNIVQPDKAFFGKKDYQQFVIIKKMVADLNMPVEVIGCPIVREADGLAMSSRNTYLSSEERQAALSLSRSLSSVNDAHKINKSLSTSQVKQMITDIVGQEKLATIDYIDVINPLTLQPFNSLTFNKDAVIVMAVYIGKTRLIDNLELS